MELHILVVIMRLCTPMPMLLTIPSGDRGAPYHSALSQGVGRSSQVTGNVTHIDMNLTYRCRHGGVIG